MISLPLLYETLINLISYNPPSVSPDTPASYSATFLTLAPASTH